VNRAPEPLMNGNGNAGLLNGHTLELQVNRVVTSIKSKFPFIVLKWGCTTGNAATVAHSTKKTTSGKDCLIEGQPLLLFM
jgi:hypothetical protein